MDAKKGITLHELMNIKYLAEKSIKNKGLFPSRKLYFGRPTSYFKI